jgi:hypothetical protein
MNPKILKEILSVHADQLVKGKAQREEYLGLVPEREEELAPLLNIAERVKSTLKPMTLANSFEEQLKRDLLAAAYLHREQGYRPPDPGRDLLILAGIMAFVISLASLLVALRLRSQNGNVRLSLRSVTLAGQPTIYNDIGPGNEGTFV